MKRWLQRVRGAIGMGLTWAAGWFGVGLALGVLTIGSGGAAFGSGLAYVAYNSLLSAFSGFLGGASFSAVLSLTEGRRRFDEMSLPRFATWGAIGGIAVAGLQLLVLLPTVGPPALVALLVQAGLLALLGAGSAAGSLALARAAEDRELLSASDDVAEVGLSKDEVRRLLGGGA